MTLTLLRHGIAEAAARSDYDRRLTHEGRRELENLLDAVIATGWKPGIILHSPLVRTTETAAVVAARFPRITSVPVDVIAYGVHDRILDACVGLPDPLVVGHEPTMGELAGLLLNGGADAMPFERGGMAIFELDKLPLTRPARLVAFLSPRLVGAAGRRGPARTPR